MEPTIHCKVLSWAPVWQIAILCVGTFISFMIAYANGSVSIYLPFFSETGAQVPQICIFSYTLILGSFVGVVMISYRFIVLKHILTREHKKLLTFNKAALWCGILSMAGLAGVAAIPMSTVLWAHLVAAGLHFVFAMCFMFLHTYINCYLPAQYSKWNKFRFGLCIGLLCFIVTLVILFPISHREWKKANSKIPALKLPQDPGFALLLSSSLFEWLLYATFLTYILTFFFEFHNFHLMITVVPTSEVIDG